MNLKTETFVTIRPKQPFLQQHIAYYYFHRTFSADFKRNFTYYPNYRVALNVFQHSNIAWNATKRFTLPTAAKKQSAIVTFSTQRHREVEMNGCINKIGIIFEPLGFNHFIDLPLHQIVEDTITDFDYYGAGFWQMTQSVFEASDPTTKRDLLDAFFLRHYRPFPIEELAFLTNQIMASNGKVSVTEMAQSLHISRKTLLRLFKKHLAHNIRGFSNLVKFRNALQLYKKHKGQLNLTQLAYESDYYDQSDFIKNIQSYTGLSPKNLFYQSKDIGGQHTLWTAKN